MPPNDGLQDISPVQLITAFKTRRKHNLAHNLTNSRLLVCDQQRRSSHSGGGRTRFGTGMATTYDDYVVLPRIVTEVFFAQTQSASRPQTTNVFNGHHRVHD